MKIAELLRHLPIRVLVSCPYARAIQTIQPLANVMNLSVQLHEDLRERQIGVFEGMSLHEAKRKVYEEFTFSFPGEESIRDAQRRAVAILQQLIRAYEGQHIVLGTHGDIMTLMMNYFDFDPTYGFEFWVSTKMPDIYKLELKCMQLREVTKQWENDVSDA